jgi:hypothetical protein
LEVLQLERDDAFARAGGLVLLEVVQEASAGWVSRQLRGEQLAAELRCLGSTPIGEVEQDGIQAPRVDVRDFPAGVEVAGLVFGRDEAAVM